MKRRFLTNILLLCLLGAAGCDNQKEATAFSKPGERWYTLAQVDRGNKLYQVYCAECHKPDASGTLDWKRLDANGKLPPPPLNGTAHTWHHPLSVLRRTVRLGGVPLGGSMPGFGDKLNAEQIDDILAWIQSNWTDEIYHVWHDRNIQAKKPLPPINRG